MFACPLSLAESRLLWKFRFSFIFSVNETRFHHGEGPNPHLARSEAVKVHELQVYEWLGEYRILTYSSDALRPCKGTSLPGKRKS
jgi:hypothetical protein